MKSDNRRRLLGHWLGPVTDLPPLLIEKGCEDYLTMLISTEFAKGRSHTFHLMCSWCTPKRACDDAVCSTSFT